MPITSHETVLSTMKKSINAHMNLRLYSRRPHTNTHYSIGQYITIKRIKCQKSLKVIGNNSLWDQCHLSYVNSLEKMWVGGDSTRKNLRGRNRKQSICRTKESWGWSLRYSEGNREGKAYLMLEEKKIRSHNL